MSINNSGQPDSRSINRPGSEIVEDRRVASWRLPIILSVGVLLLIVLIGIALYFIWTQPRPFETYQGRVPPTPVNDKPPPHFTPGSDAEMPPLFPGLTIKRRQEGIMFKTEEDLDGPVLIRGVQVEANIKSPQDVELAYELVNYYHEYFSKYNWENYLAGDRPGSSINGWKKNGRYFIIEIQVNIKSGTTSALLLYSQSLDSAN